MRPNKPREVIPLLLTLILCSATAAFADHEIRAYVKEKGGMLCLLKTGELVFGSDNTGNCSWIMSEHHKQAPISNFVGGKRQYLTVDPDGKKIYMSATKEAGSTWEYVAIGLGKGGSPKSADTTIKTVEKLNGGPYYLAVDVDHPKEVKGLIGDEIITVYPVKITTKANLTGTKMTTTSVPL